jgi:predicted deacylase
MKKNHHPLASTYLGTHREIVSFHYGEATGGTKEKIYIQASLHADELPGMLVAHHLRLRLAALEAAGKLNGEVVVVPVANPPGLAQTILHSQMGRFDAATGENYNRHYPALFSLIGESLEGKLTSDMEPNKHAVRGAMRESLAANPPTTELGAMRHILLTLACDADVVLDLHCDSDAALHLYTGTPLWPQCEPLARYMGAAATLLATESGDNPFDEACSQTWWQLAEKYAGRFPIPLACLSVTVELRGQGDVNHHQAGIDADAILAYLAYRDVILDTAPELPALIAEATPLAGSEPIDAPISGVVVFLKSPGERVVAGDAIAEIIDPISGDVRTVSCKTDGIMYARENRYFASAGMRLAKVAGKSAFRTGKLLSA